MARDYHHRPRKRFGQNFLIDGNIIDRIVQAIHAGAAEHIIEIGPGQGAITEQLIRECGHLSAIEIDRDLAADLQNRFASLSNFSLLEQDVLTVDFNTFPENQDRLTIVGNLPYNISTPLLFHLFTFSHRIDRMIFMLQKEVVERICAQPGEPNYGRLSIMTQYFCQTKKLFNVPATAFHPAPKVESAIIKLSPWESRPYQASNFDLFADLVRSAFSQRRKTLRNSLKQYLVKDILEDLEIDSSLRPENLSVQDYVRISNQLDNTPPEK